MSLQIFLSSFSFHKTLFDPEIVSHNFFLFISKLLTSFLLGVFIHLALPHATISYLLSHYTQLLKNVWNIYCVL